MGSQRAHFRREYNSQDGNSRTAGMIEHCCEMLQEAVENDAVLNQPLRQMHGRILNEVDSDYAVRSPEDRPRLYPINFCPFCGRAVSRSVWNAEKKKQGF